MNMEAARISPETIPVVDISGLSSSDPAAKAAVGKAFHDACVNHGFLYLSGHGIPQGLIDAVLAQSKALFDLPVEAKQKISKDLSNCNRGWEPVGTQSLDPTAPPDMKENFYLGLELAEDHPKVQAGRFNHGPNQWPADLPGFRPTMRAYHAAMLDLGERLMTGLALSLDLPEDYFADFHKEPLSTLRLLHYPPQPADALEGQAGAGAHSDYGALTMLLQDENGGLQVQDKDGKWIHAEPIPGTFVFNIGDAIARWTNGKYKSTIHRVVNTSGKERYSVPFFYSGNPDQSLAALPGCIAEGETPLYPEATVEQHMREMYQRSYDAAKKS